MKKEIVRTVLVCDWCGSKENVRSYPFHTIGTDERGRTESEESVELCAFCQCKAYNILKSTSFMSWPLNAEALKTD